MNQQQILEIATRVLGSGWSFSIDPPSGELKMWRCDIGYRDSIIKTAARLMNELSLSPDDISDTIDPQLAGGSTLTGDWVEMNIAVTFDVSGILDL